MAHRIFIAINLPTDVRDKLYLNRDEYPELPARWTKRENLHLTLMFLGYTADQELPGICQTVQETAKKHSPFFLEFDKITYAPPGKPPRMIWANGQPSKELARLQRDLEAAFFEKQTGMAEKKDIPGFSPHITMARLKEWEFRKIEPDEVPQVDKEISLNFSVESIEVMESELGKQGPEYTILESCPFSG